MQRTWSTDRLPERERFDHWREIVSEAFVPVSIARGDAEDFCSSVSAHAVGALRISRIASASQSVVRTPSRDERASYFLNLPLTPGTSATQRGRRAALGVGDFTIVDSDEPFSLSFPRRFTQVSVQIPRELLDAHGVGASHVATQVDGSQGIGAVVSGALRTFATDVRALDRQAGREVAEHLCGLIAVALLSDPPPPRLSTRERLLRDALAEVDAGLGDPELSPRTVAQRISVSPRYLHRLFAERGTTFGRCLLERRLQRGHERLSDPAEADRSIGQIAHEVGFPDASYFARAFKSRYGVTPGQARRGATVHAR